MRKLLKAALLVVVTVFTLRQLFFSLWARIDSSEEEAITRFWDITIGLLCGLLVFGWFHGRLRNRLPRASLFIYIGCSVLVSSCLIGLHVAQVRARSPSRNYIHLKKLVNTCYMYADEHSGNFPRNWGDLVPYDNVQPAYEPSFSNLTDWSDYVYISGLTTDSPPDWIVAYGRPYRNEDDKWIPTVFVGGNVQSLSLQAFTNALYKNPGYQTMQRTSYDIH